MVFMMVARVVFCTQDDGWLFVGNGRVGGGSLTSFSLDAPINL